MTKHDKENKKSKPNTSNLPWVEKYRPKKLDNIVGHEHIVATLKEFLKEKDMHHLLFYGPPGTGKTSAIISTVNEFYGNNFSTMVLELNVSNKRGIDTVRDDILNFVSVKGCQNSLKMVILDETDAMTDDAQCVLRNIIEKYTFNARFCLICNHLNKINPALISRCTKFYFKPLDKKNIIKRMNEIIKSENIEVTEEAKELLIDRSKGDMRNILNGLQSMSITRKKVTEDDVNEYVAYPTKKITKKIFKYLNKKIETAFKKIKKIQKKKGFLLTDIMDAISKYIINEKVNNKEIILIKMAKIENNLTSNISEKNQLLAFCGILKN